MRFLAFLEKSALGELRCTTGGLQTGLLTLLHTRITGQETGLLQGGTVLGIYQQQCAADAMAQSRSEEHTSELQSPS